MAMVEQHDDNVTGPPKTTQDSMMTTTGRRRRRRLAFMQNYHTLIIKSCKLSTEVEGNPGNFCNL